MNKDGDHDGVASPLLHPYYCVPLSSHHRHVLHRTLKQFVCVSPGQQATFASFILPVCPCLNQAHAKFATRITHCQTHHHHTFIQTCNLEPTFDRIVHNLQHGHGFSVQHMGRVVPRRPGTYADLVTACCQRPCLSGMQPSARPLCKRPKVDLYGTYYHSNYILHVYTLRPSQLSSGLSTEYQSKPHATAKTETVDADKALFAKYYVHQIMQMDEDALRGAWNKVRGSR